MSTEINILIDIFWNHVRLGQWEFSKATAKLILNLSSDEYKNLFLPTVLQPKKNSYGSRSISTSNHLLWLALQEMCKNETPSNLPQNLFKEVEFNFLIQNLEIEAPASIIKELKQYHSQLIKEHSDYTESSTELAHISTVACGFLGQHLCKEPLLILNLIIMLGKHCVVNNVELFQLIINQVYLLIDTCLTAIGSHFRDNLQQCIRFFNIVKSYVDQSDNALQERFKCLVQKTLKSTPVLVKQLSTALLNFNDPTLTKEMSTIEESYRMQKIEEHFGVIDELSCLEISLAFFINWSEENFEDLFMLCYRNRVHMLKCILDGCILLIQQHKHERVASILSHPFLKPLTPLVILVSWTRCLSFEEADLLLKHLLPNQENIGGIFGPSCKMLLYQSKLIQWCMEKISVILGVNFDASSLLNMLFKQLENSSVLYVLNETKLLKTLQYDEVVDLLEKQNEIDKSFMSSSAEHVNIYRCFFVLKRFISLLVASKTGKFLTDENVVVDFSSEFLAEMVIELKKNIEEIPNITVKVEILENIFSLLFLRTSDFKDCPKEEDIDIDNIEDSSRDSSISQSFDSYTEENAVEVMEKEMKKTRRTLIFTQVTEIPDEKKVLTKDDINQALLQEIEGSSSDTLKQRERYHSHELIHDSHPAFVASAGFTREILNLLSECLISVSAERFSTGKIGIQESGSKKDSLLDYRISSLQAYTREGQWRLQLITGFEAISPNMLVLSSKKSLRNLSNDHVISRMLGSSENLVYLSLKKGDLKQAKQVVKMFDMKDNSCSIELDFIEQLQQSIEFLKKIRKIQQKNEKSYSNMDFIKSMASAGKLSSEVNQITEMLLHHKFIERSEYNSSFVSLAVLCDLMYSTNKSLHVAKSLSDSACSKIDDCTLDSEIMLTAKAKDFKSALSLILNENFEMFKLWSDETPEDFLTIVLTLPSSFTKKNIEFYESCISEGKTAFKIFSGTVHVLQSTINVLQEPTESTKHKSETSLKETFRILQSVLNHDVLSELNDSHETYDYFKSLSKYVYNLAGIQLYYQTKSKSKSLEDETNKGDSTTESVRPLKVANPFVIFEQSVSKIFGRLLFEWKVSPRKLEQLAKQSGVNLVRGVTENCGVTVSVQDEETPVIQKLLLSQNLLILNSEEEQDIKTDDSHSIDTQIKSPDVIVAKLLGLVMQKISGSGEKTPTSAVEILETIHSKSKELQYCNISSLSSNQQPIAFIVNLFNLMFFHLTLVIHAKKEVHQVFPYFISPQVFQNLLSNSLGRLLLFKTIAYRIGGLGVVSLLELYHLLFGRCKVGLFGLNTEELCKNRSKGIATWNVDSTDPRVFFLLSLGTEDCPPHKVVNAADLDITLNTCASKYLENRIGIDEEKKEVFLPEMLHLHKSIFIPKSSDGKSSNNMLLGKLSEYVGDVLRTKLQKAIENNFHVSIENHNWTLRYGFLFREDFLLESSVDISNKNKPTTVCSSLPPAISTYLTNTCPLAGCFIELSLVKNDVGRTMSTILQNNILCYASNKEDVSMGILVSLHHGLSKFTKICSDYLPLKNFVIESCSYLNNILEKVAHFEGKLTVESRKRLYNSLESIFTHKFLLTLSPDKWTHLSPALIECSVQLGICHEIDLEFLTSLQPPLFDLVIVEGVHEIKHKLTERLYKRDDRVKYTRILKRSLLLVKDFVQRTELILSVIHLLSAKDACDLLYVCLERKQNLNEEFERTVEEALREVKWCDQVYNMCMRSSSKNTFDDWQDVKNCVVDDPDHIVWFLNDTKAFHLIDEWFDLFQLSDDVIQKCLQSKVVNELSNPALTDLKIENMLSRSPSKKMSLKICQHVLDTQTSYRAEKKHVLNYILHNLFDLLPREQKKAHVCNRLGIGCIQLIPSGIRKSYYELEKEPLLVLEQLLMNVKMSVANKVVAYIHSEMKSEYASSFVSTLIQQCDDLFGRYASLSLTMSTVQVQKPSTDAPISSPLKEKLEESIIEQNSSMMEHPKPPASSEFVPPAQSVAKSKWVKDEMVSACMQCKDLFSMFNRRHHCRHCGRVVCGVCSNYFSSMTGSKMKERACKPCFYFLGSPPTSPSNPGRKLTGDSRIFKAPILSPINMLEQTEWVLGVDWTGNNQLREDFYFEQAPSAALCLSIIDLYSNTRAASGLLLKFCNDLSQYLQEPKEEVDVSIVAGMIEFILNHAKLKFMKSGDFGGVELCDTYLSRVEILKILLESNWHDIPTMQEFAQPESLRRLRDKLMEKERFTLALELTSKCGLDATPVHFLMGISRLKCGELEKAREHLSRCLTLTRGEASTAFGPNHHYLQRIINVIESTPLITFYQVDKDSPPLAVILHEEVKNSTRHCTLDNRRYNEILHYLEAYGSHGHMIQFFVRNQLLTEAIAYIKDKKCSAELFTSQLLQSCFQDGSFEELCEKIRLSDPSFKFWEPYFAEACRYFSKHANYHCLYEIQIYMKDYFNAALSCVRFYLGTMGQPASSYGEFHKRIHYLQKATKHLELLIKERNSKSSFVSHVGSSFLDKQISNQEIPTSKLKQHLSTVNLQIDVTNFMLKMKSAESKVIAKKSQRTSTPTLFGNGKERAELAVLILLYSVDDSLPLASRIIQEYKLPSSSVFGHTVKRMAQEQKYAQVISTLQNIEKNGMIQTSEKDDILLKVIKITVQHADLKESTQFIKQVRGEVARINAFIICGRLREAYLEAVKKNRVNEIQRVLDEARLTPNQSSMVGVCEKWLKAYHENQMEKDLALSKSKMK